MCKADRCCRFYAVWCIVFGFTFVAMSLCFVWLVVDIYIRKEERNTEMQFNTNRYEEDDPEEKIFSRILMTATSLFFLLSSVVYIVAGALLFYGMLSVSHSFIRYTQQQQLFISERLKCRILGTYKYLLTHSHKFYLQQYYSENVIYQTVVNSTIDCGQTQFDHLIMALNNIINKIVFIASHASPQNYFNSNYFIKIFLCILTYSFSFLCREAG